MGLISDPELGGSFLKQYIFMNCAALGKSLHVFGFLF